MAFARMPDKDPDATLDYVIDWEEWLPDGDIVTASEWSVPDGITAAAHAYTDTTSTVWLSGGVVGETYFVENRITTDAGRITDRTFRLKIKEM